MASGKKKLTIETRIRKNIWHCWINNVDALTFWSYVSDWEVSSKHLKDQLGPFRLRVFAKICLSKDPRAELSTDNYILTKLYCDPMILSRGADQGRQGLSLLKSWTQGTF